MIAQQIKEYFPTIINYGQDTIPNIYKIAKSKLNNNNIILYITHDINLNNITRIKIYPTLNSRDIIVDIINFTNDTITIKMFDGYIDNQEILVYGYEIDDFHSINQSQLTSISLGGIQELSKQIDKLKSENNDLRIKLETLLQVKP
jgi:hypothetical protein